MRRFLLFVLVCAVGLACDTRKPTEPPRVPISITSPLKNAVVNDTVNVVVSVGQGYSFTHVDFLVDSDTIGSDSSMPFSCKWFTGIYRDQSWHVLKAIGYDPMAVAYESDTVRVKVTIPGGPIAIIRPADGAIVTDSVRITCRQALAYDFSRVVFYVNSDSVGIDTTSEVDSIGGIPFEIFSLGLDLRSVPDNSTIVATVKAVEGDSIFYAAPITFYVMTDTLRGRFDPISVFATAGPTFAVTVTSNILAIAGGTNGVWLVDVGWPNSPLPVFTIQTPGQAQGLASNWPYLVLADGDQGVACYDISVPDSVHPTGVYDTPGLARQVSITGDFVYVADQEALEVLRLGAGTFRHLSRLTIGSDIIKDVAGQGARCLVLDQSGLTVVDFSDSLAPAVLGRFTSITGVPSTVATIDTFAFVGTSAEVVKLSIARPNSIRFLGRSVQPDGVSGIYAGDSLVFASLKGSNGGVVAFDYRHQAGLVQLDRYTNSDNCADVYCVGPFVFLAGQTKVEILRFVR